METISIIGIIAALVLLFILIMKGVNIFVAAAAATVVIALTGQINVYMAFTDSYMSGFVGFIKSNFLVFVAGALLGKVYEITNGAKSIARLIVKGLGPKYAVFAIPLAVGLMTYGGIAGYVLCFAVFPIALEVFRASDIPRRFIPAAIVMGCCTFSSWGPGTPQLPNVALSKALSIPLTAGFTCGIITVVLQAVFSLLMLKLVVSKAQSNGEHFIAKQTDVFKDDAVMPGGALALIPLALTLLCINIKVNGTALVPTEFGIAGGAALAYILMRTYHADGQPLMQHVGTAISNAISSAAVTSAMVAIGSVAKAAVGFPTAINGLTSIAPGVPLVSVAIGGILAGGICGSATGGTGIVAPLFAPIFAAKGLAMEVMGRVIVTGAHFGGTLPNNGFINTVTSGIAKETYKDSYGPVFLVVTVGNLFATVVAVILFTILPNLP